MAKEGALSKGALVKTVTLTDKKRIEDFLRRDPFLYIHALGDLDDYFWPHTTWHALLDGGEIKAVIVVYTGLSQPVIIALSDDAGVPFLVQLIRSTLPDMPARCAALVNPAAVDALETRFQIRSHGLHFAMGLTETPRLDAIDSSNVVPLSKSDLDGLMRLYAESYPGSYFEPSMLEVGPFYGLRRDGVLVSAAGVLVYSKAYKVAALGNIATHPAHRGRGFAKTVVAELCRGLLGTVDHIALGVRSDNVPAIRCYEALGFETVGFYEQCSAEAR